MAQYPNVPGDCLGCGSTPSINGNHGGAIPSAISAPRLVRAKALDVETDEPRVRNLAAAATDDEVFRQEGSRFDARPEKATARAEAERELSRGRRQAVVDEQESSRWKAILDEADPVVAVKNPDDAPSWKDIPRLPAFLLGLCIVAGAFNGYYFVSKSGMEFSNAVVDVLAVSVVFTLAPSVLFKWMLSGVSDRRRRRIETLLKRLSLLLAATGQVVFAYVFGYAMEPVDLFSAAGARGSGIPMWVMLGVSMALENLAAIALVSSIVASLRSIHPENLQIGPHYAFAVAQLEIVRRREEANLAEMASHESVLKSLAAEREQAISDLLIRVRAYRAVLQAKLQAASAEMASRTASERSSFLRLQV